ncbi:hypothetical protein LTR37_002968 [Vermiconidia calcicola]|uniref:Uncharacterized protein n=1 Tax=Vermiconidia calcicola TaxID=1690605 RepID=A0ACC3NRE7_9PEZI|nr:hypothetical protein LTR37_002968 [Vermiconidia calcicola]
MQPKGYSGSKKVAIVGSGCAGLGAAWALKNTDYEIHLFEKDVRLGGHTNTQPFSTSNGQISVDTGFIVMNSATYPNFISFLNEVGVTPVPTEMTFAVSRDQGKFEWSGDGKGVFAQRRNLFRPRHWRLIFDVVRFNQYALDLLDKEDDVSRSLTIGKYLDREGYSQAFRDDYLIPMTAAVWSTSPDKASLEFPAQTLIRFMWNHHLLSTIGTRPDWLTITGGSQRYIDAILETLGDQLRLHLSSQVRGIARPSASSKNRTAVSWVDTEGNASDDVFDHVILACHGDQVLPMIADNVQLEKLHDGSSSCKWPCCNDSVIYPSKADSTSGASQQELEIFSAFKTSENICYLHSDLSLMPTRRNTWSSWNYMISSTPSQQSSPAGVSLTYNMNILQHISERKYGHVLVTMNPGHEPRQNLTQGKYIYRHPLYTVEAVRAQERLESIQNQRGVSYCGAWTKYGFHEDGFSSGLKVAKEHLGAKLPFEFVDSTYSRGLTRELAWQDYAVRALVWFIRMMIGVGSLLLRLPLVWLPAKIMLNLFSAFLEELEHARIID